jgi:hypothetical protein
MRRMFRYVLVVAATGSLVACVGAPEIAADAVAKERLNALVGLDNRKLDALNCAALAAHPEQDDLSHTTLAGLSAQVMGLDVKMNLAYPAVKLLHSDGKSARVQVKTQVVAAMAMADTAVQVFSLDDTWNMARENGQWKYCGSATGHVFTRDDLARFVLQPGDVTAVLTRNRSTDDVSQVFSLDGKEFQPFGPLAQETRSFDAQGKRDNYQANSHAVLFKDVYGANRAFLHLAQTMIVDGCGNRKDLRVEGLGQAGMGYALSDHNWNYIWRMGNIVMYLEVNGDVFSPFNERDARALAGRIQARLVEQ